MKRQFFTYLIFIILGFTSLVCQNEINFNYGSPIIVDGIISPQEWNDSDSIEIITAGDKIVKVFFKNDGINLLFLYKDNLGSANFRFPEILLDINNDKSQQWMNDDWWFHVSTTNCFNRGAHSVYNANTCKTVQPEWEANNFSVSVPDTVEIKIPYSLFGLDSNIEKIGIAFDVTNTYSAWEFYPVDAIMNTPETWATGNLMKATSVDGDSKSEDFPIEYYPNPGSGLINFRYSLAKPNRVKLIVYNIIGKKIATLVDENQEQGEFEFTFDISELEPGVYFYNFNTGDIFKSGKLILIR